MVTVGAIRFHPPLLNSACPWASSLDDLKALYLSKSTGAVTTRTATLNGFPDDPSVHQVAFTSESISSINSYGYSPHPLSQYIEWVRDILSTNLDSNKPIIISITPSVLIHNSVDRSPGRIIETSELDKPLSSSGSDPEIKLMIEMVQNLRRELDDVNSASPRIAIELNTSCPNIQGHHPPAYQPESLRPLVEAMDEAYASDPTLTFGLKLPPYVYSLQFAEVVDFVASFSKNWKNPIAFFTCTNTLGSAMLFGDQTTKKDGSDYAVPSIYGGLAGEHLHPLALGNVHSFVNLIKHHKDEGVRRIVVIGVGGVTNKEAVVRMIKAGASAVACATILGRDGVSVFDELVKAF